MSEIISQKGSAAISVYCGRERSDGYVRTEIEVTVGNNVPLQMTGDEFTDLLAAINTAWFEQEKMLKLPICLDGRCQNGVVPHGKRTDCQRP